MGLFDTVGKFIKNFKDAAAAGADFNPLLNEVMEEIEKLHAEGKLNDVIYQAEQAYEKEHAAYQAKGSHTDAADSKNDSAALKHFVSALATSKNLPGDLQAKAAKIVDLEKTMTDALGIFGKFVG